MSDLGAELERLIRAIVREEIKKALAEHDAKPPPDHVTVREFARRWSLSRTTVRDAIRDGRLPAMRVGRAVRVLASASIAKPLNVHERARQSVRDRVDEFVRRERIRAGTIEPDPRNPADAKFVARLHWREETKQKALVELMELPDMATALGLSEARARELSKAGRIPFEKVLGWKLYRRATIAKMKAKGWRP